MKWHGWWLAALLASQPAMAEDLPERIPFAAPVTVGADGAVDVGDVEWVQGKLAEIAAAELAGLPYVRGQADGNPVASSIMVSGVLVLEPIGDEFAISIEGLATQPLLLAWRPADYDIEMLRARRDGEVSLLLEVDADGRVVGSEVLSATGKRFSRAARAAVADWRFAPSASGFTVGAPFWFHGNWTAGPTVPVVACTVQPQLAHLAGEDGCLGISETTGGRYARGEVPAEPLNLVPTPALPAAGGFRSSDE